MRNQSKRIKLLNKLKTLIDVVVLDLQLIAIKLITFYNLLINVIIYHRINICMCKTFAHECI